jgi:RND superfamily putative drug exporter
VERALARLAERTARRRRAVAAAWLLLLVLAAPLASQQTSRLSGGGWDVPGSDSGQVKAALHEFPGHEGERFAVFVSGSAPGPVAAAVAQARTLLARERDLRVGTTVELAGGRAALVPAGYVGPSGSVYDYLTGLRARLVVDRPAASTRVVGEDALWSDFQAVSKRQLARAETIGFPFVVAVLLLAFGTLVAALAPLAIGAVAVTISGGAIFLLSGPFELSVYVSNVASMIGIGVSVDYSLFVVSRYRAALRAGAAPEEALPAALASAGTAVVFSGLTVLVSLASLFAVDVTAIRSMAVGAIVVVAVAVLCTVTLLPALLALAGARTERLRVPLGRRGSSDRWRAWSARIMRRPLAAFLLGAAAILVLASPLLAIDTRTGAFDQLPRGSEVRAATERLAAVAGAGVTGPVEAVVPDRRAAVRVVALADRLPGVEHVAAPLRSRDGTRWLVEIVPTGEPDSAQAQGVVRRLRATGVPGLRVGGVTAANADVNAAIFGQLWKMILFIVACALAVLTVLLRSVVLPLKAVVMNVLSVGASYGVLVAVFQWGWLDWSGYRSPGYVDTVVPVLLLGVAFGLSMDYEVFLLTRIRERFLADGDTRMAVAEGLAESAHTITAAALVMVVVFAAFAIAGPTSIKELGVGLAAAIAIDATVVRLVLVPSAMVLLGRWNWWLPRPPWRRSAGRASLPVQAQ